MRRGRGLAGPSPGGAWRGPSPGGALRGPGPGGVCRVGQHEGRLGLGTFCRKYCGKTYPHRKSTPSGTTASRWPLGRTIELDLNVTARTGDFACTSLITEVLAPDPLGRIWLVNHFPDYQMDHEHERELQAVRAARAVDDLLPGRPGHVVVAGDLDADPDATSIRFWTGRHALEGLSVCYRDAWESARPGEPGDTYVPGNPYSADWDWPFRRIDYILVRCGGHGGPTLRVSRCERTFDTPATTVSDHYGLVADLALPPG